MDGTNQIILYAIIDLTNQRVLWLCAESAMLLFTLLGYPLGEKNTSKRNGLHQRNVEKDT